MGRLKDGVSVDQANAEFVGLARRLAQENPKTNGTLVSASVQSLLNTFTGPQLRQTVWTMLAAVVLVLLIACVNVMNMQFGRSALRAKELAIRGALGATRWRLVRQMLTETLLVAMLGAVAGVLLAHWAIDLLIRTTNALPFPLPYWVEFKIDIFVLAFTVGIALLSLFQACPALLCVWQYRGDDEGRWTGNTSRLVNHYLFAGCWSDCINGDAVDRRDTANCRFGTRRRRLRHDENAAQRAWV
jgi:ABC-type antimicrobial peptide transport system permease subunit